MPRAAVDSNVMPSYTSPRILISNQQGRQEKHSILHCYPAAGLSREASHHLLEMSFSFLDKLSSNTEEGKDDFDSITCPNTFEDDSQIDQFFDTHKSTPSPNLRRSQRLKKQKQSEGKENVSKPAKKVIQVKTPPKASSGTSYASCSSSTPFATPPSDMKKAATTPGPPPRSLLKVAIGNSLRNKALNEDVTIVVPPRRTGPQTSTPKRVTKTVKVSETVKDHQIPTTSDASGTVKKAPQRKTVLIANSNTVVKSEAVRAVVKRKLSSSTIKPAAHVTASANYKVVAPRIDIALSRAASARSAAAKPGTSSGQSRIRALKKSIGEKINGEKPVKRRSLKTIVKKRPSEVKKTDAIKNRVAAARKAAAENRAKPPKSTAGQYGHVKSRVAEMINNGPAISAPNVRDMKRRAADVKAVKKVLHDKPFLPAGKVKYNAAVELMPGDLTVNGQTMAQFVKNFQYQTPPRYRSLKPTDKFQNTCVNHNIQGPNPTIPKSPKFATKGRRRNPVK